MLKCAVGEVRFLADLRIIGWTLSHYLSLYCVPVAITLFFTLSGSIKCQLADHSTIDK